MKKFLGVSKTGKVIVNGEKLPSDSKYKWYEILTSQSMQDIIINSKFDNGKMMNAEKNFEHKKIALVFNYGQKCGISSYSEKLYKELTPLLDDWKIFSEENEGNKSNSNIFNVDSSKLSFCWKRGEYLNKLYEELVAYNPDVVLIQHEWGIFPRADIWLSFITNISRRFKTIVTMHSTFEHLDKGICESAISEIIVHLEGGKKVLREDKKISSQIHIVPHGCDQYDGSRLWNLYRTNHTILQWGYAYPYKGYEKSLEAVAILKEKFNDVFYTGICSISEHSKAENFIYYDKLQAKVDALGIRENVALLKGFQTDEIIKTFIKTNKVALFPYESHPEHLVYGASGAVRQTMANCIPVVTSSIPHFSDVPSIKADSATQIAEAISRLFTDKFIQKQQLEVQEKFIEDNSWKKIALKYLEIINS